MTLDDTEAEDHELLPNPADPRVLLAGWANDSDDWVRFIVSDVIATGRPISSSTVDSAYTLFRQEKALETRALPAVEALSTAGSAEDQPAPLCVVRVSEVTGVNALITGEVIEPNAGLTILYGENGTGKTGYARIFKALADSRTADEILGNIASETPGTPRATIEYDLGGDPAKLVWAGERGVAPFTRMSIFDSPSVEYHVDDDLEYVYTPAALALFNHVIAGIQAVQAKIDEAISDLASSGSTLLSRFPRESSVYPDIETLGASTDLETLRVKADTAPDVDSRIEVLRQAVAALEPTRSRPRSRCGNVSSASCSEQRRSQMRSKLSTLVRTTRCSSSGRILSGTTRRSARSYLPPQTCRPSPTKRGPTSSPPVTRTASIWRSSAPTTPTGASTAANLSMMAPAL